MHGTTHCTKCFWTILQQNFTLPVDGSTILHQFFAMQIPYGLIKRVSNYFCYETQNQTLLQATKK